MQGRDTEELGSCTGGVRESLKAETRKESEGGREVGREGERLEESAASPKGQNPAQTLCEQVAASQWRRAVMAAASPLVGLHPGSSPSARRGRQCFKCPILGMSSRYFERWNKRTRDENAPENATNSRNNNKHFVKVKIELRRVAGNLSVPMNPV